MKRCAIYTRKSTSHGLDQEFNSLEAQFTTCAEYVARQEGWTVIPKRYDDGGFTGANTDRPAFQELMNDLAAGKVDVVVVYKIDRLSRSLLDFANLMERFRKTGTYFVSVTQPFLSASNDAMAQLLLNILMAFAQFERQMIAERTRDKIRATRARGQWSGGHTPFGYRSTGSGIVPVEEEARIVRTLFETFVETRSLGATVRALNQAGLYPRTRQSKHGPGWTKNAVAYVLHSPIYAGQLRVGDLLVPGKHATVVDLEKVTEARTILQERRFSTRDTHRGNQFPLRGKLRCGQCDSSMTPVVTRKGSTSYRYYRCCGRDRCGTEVCSGKPVPAEAVEQFVAEQLGVPVSELPAAVREVRLFEGSGRAEIDREESAA